MTRAGRHLSWQQFRHDMLEPGVPALHLIPGSPKVVVFVDAKAAAMGIRVSVPWGLESPGIASAAIRVRQILVGDGAVLELSTSDRLLFGAFYDLAVRIADLVQLEGMPAKAAVEQAVREFRRLLVQAAALSEAQVTGIWGELWCLDSLVEAWGPAAVMSWFGPDAEAQDFRFQRFALEVKTTRESSRRHLINGVSQLTPPPGLTLFLLSITVVRSGPAGGATLAALAAAIDARLAAAPDARTAFQDRLRAIHCVEDDELVSAYGLELASPPRLISIDATVPRLSREMLQAVFGAAGAARIEDAEYVLNCEGFGFEVTRTSLARALPVGAAQP